MANPKTLKPKPFKKGYDPRRHVKQKGERSFRKIFEEACREVSKSLNLGVEPDRVMVEIVKRGIKEIFKGNYAFYKDTLDRYFGKPMAKIEVQEEKKILILDDEDEEGEEEGEEEKNH